MGMLPVAIVMALSTALLALPAKATVFFKSDLGSEESCQFTSGAVTCIPQVVDAHPVWTVPAPNTWSWVSGADSGFGVQILFRRI
jgi:hypothetical protein